MAAMGSLVAGVAHEVRNPLFGISATLDAFEARFGQKPEHRQYVAVLRGELARLSHLMGDLLEYGKPTTLEFSEGALGDVVAEAVVGSRPLAEQSGVALRNAVDGTLPTVRMDRRRLLQVFQNLLDNAVKYGREGSVVVIAVARTGGERLPAPRDPREKRPAAAIEVAVIDQGEGVPPEHLSRLTERFYRVDRGRSRQLGGTGLGLAIVKHILNRHGGRLTIESKLGQGSRFAVLFPAAAASDRKA
jgi:two-component system phosphate regulon sensor histidine kinase PhoR